MKKFICLALLLTLIFSFCFSALAAEKEFDVNGSGDVNLLDVLEVLKEVVSATPNIAMDVNKNGVVELADAIYLLKEVVNGGSGSVAVYYSYTDIVARMTDTKLLATDNTNEESEMFTSYERRSVYEDGVYKNWRVNARSIVGTSSPSI